MRWEAEKCGEWGLISNHFRCAVCLELQIVCSSSRREKDGEYYQAGGGLRRIWPGNWTGATFNSKAIHSKPQPKRRVCWGPRSNSWAPHPFACLDMCVCETDRKRKRLIFSDLCHNMLRGLSDTPCLKPHTHTHNDIQYRPMDIMCWFPGDKLCSGTDVPCFLCWGNSFSSCFTGWWGIYYQ